MTTNIGLMLKKRAEVSPQQEAFVDPEAGLRTTFAGLNDYTNQCVSVLQGLGLRRGDRLALLLHNSQEFLGLFYAAAKIGAVAVPLNTRLAPSELSFILSDSGSTVLVSHEDFNEVVAQLREAAEHPLDVKRWITVEGDSDSDAGSTLAAMLAVASHEEPHIDSGDEDNMFIMYTSGTTGAPKGVVHTHNSVMWSALNGTATLDVRYQDRLLLPLPMFHVAALGCVIFCTLRGAAIISMSKFDPVSVWPLIEEERVTIAGSVPAVLNFMRQTPGFETFNAPDFRYFITGAAPMPRTLIELYNEKNMEVSQGYALTESCASGTVLMNEDGVRKIGSCGKPMLFTELCVLDENGEKQSVGIGEVLMKGPHMLKEYWNRPDATAEAFDDGWFKTGDIAEIDDEGFVFIKDRIKDMIISGGENIYPAEIENVIQGHPGVSEVAVIGLPDEKWGEIACAVVVRAGDELGEADVIACCEEKLSRFKLPKKVV
ncbi:MAG: long-chain fatty acid--CoA ligase, partial [Gammaproteobacteria bacterium]|nr:long-chain fatty acid--CoA ligase [Gammaproteobacteria bacterium]